MSDPTVTTAAEPTIALDPTTSKPLAAPPAAPSAPASEGKPPWLDARLDQARQSLLKELGFESVEAGKKAATDLHAKLEAEKSDAQKRGELEASLKQERDRSQAMSATLGAYAKGQLSTLTEAQRNAVTAVAGEDPAKQLQTIEALRPTWATTSAPAAPPKDTAPAPAAPKDGNVSAPPDQQAQHDELKKTNPVLAARFAMANGLFNK